MLADDLRQTLRGLRKAPGFTLVAVLTIALGVGANTALFSIVDGVLLRPLPFPDADRLVGVHASKPNFDRGSISYPNFLDWRRANTVFSDLAVSRNSSFIVTGQGTADQVNGAFVSSDFLPLLGVRPILGRGLNPGEDEVGAAPVVLIGAALWQRRFGASREVLGATLTLDGRPYTIVGVVPGFPLSAPNLPRTAEVYVPIGQWPNDLLLSRGAGLGIHGIGRLKPGVTLVQARADMEAVTRSLAEAYPEENKGVGAALVPLKDQIVGPVRSALLLLFAAVAFVLLIACVNVATSCSPARAHGPGSSPSGRPSARGVAGSSSSCSPRAPSSGSSAAASAWCSPCSGPVRCSGCLGRGFRASPRSTSTRGCSPSRC